MKGFASLLVAVLVAGRAVSTATPRRLEMDLQEQVDDAKLFPSSNLMTDQSIAAQMLMASLNQPLINFNDNLDNISAQLDAVRRNVDTTLSNQIRISALNAYINNAVLMNNLGLLNNAEDESLINPIADSYIASKKARKLTKSVRGELSVGLARKTKLFHPEKTVRRRVRMINPKSRKLVKMEEVPKEAVAAEPPAPSNRPPERRLRENKWIPRAYVPPHPPKKPQNLRVSPIARLRSNDEMLELAKKGSLFRVDFGDVYHVTNDDMSRYMEPKGGRPSGSI